MQLFYIPKYISIDMANIEALQMLAVILTVSVVSKVLADKFSLPNIIFLLISGIILGPSGVGFITQSQLGGSLTSIVGFAVAIIVFEGAFHLKIEKIRRATDPTLRLVTVGAAVALLGTASLIYVFLPADIELSLLIGSLLVATGPTVITPILDVTSVRQKVETAMETEGIVNDVTAAILAIVIFESFIIGETSTSNFAYSFLSRLGIGVIVGIIGSFVMYYTVDKVVPENNRIQNSRLLILVGAIVIYTLANTVATEAGVASVAVAGIILGNLSLPHAEEIEEFKGDITPIVLSIVFIILAALADIQSILQLGISGAIVVTGVMFLVRPILVFISGYKTKLSIREQVFMSLVAPRGIIPASVASLFAIKLQSSGFQQSAQVLVSTVFLVIFVTVLLQAGTATVIAKKLDIIPMHVVIIGAGRTGRTLADMLESRKEDVILIDKNKQVVEQAKENGYNVKHGDATKNKVLEEAGIEDAGKVISVTEDDSTNFLCSQIASTQYDTDDVILRTSREENIDTFEQFGVKAVSGRKATARIIDNIIDAPVLSRWIEDYNETGDARDVVIQNSELVGMRIDEANKDLPEDCMIVLVTRENETHVPDGTLELREGDKVSLLGERAPVESAIEYCRT
jgi:NhaP-type Na+/H+ or K+/H+ antiporter